MKELTPLPNSRVEEFINEYFSRIHIPINKDCKPFIICPVGRIKAGKTTLTTGLEDQLDISRISPDDVRILLRIENSFKSSEYRKIICPIMERIAGTGMPFIMDSNCASLWTRELLEKISEQYNIPLVWVHINPADEWIIEKLKHFNYEKGQLFTGPEDGIRRFKEHLLNFPDISDISFDYTVDSSKSDYWEDIKKIGQDIYKKYKK